MYHWKRWGRFGGEGALGIIWAIEVCNESGRWSLHLLFSVPSMREASQLHTFDVMHLSTNKHGSVQDTGQEWSLTHLGNMGHNGSVVMMGFPPCSTPRTFYASVSPFWGSPQDALNGIGLYIAPPPHSPPAPELGVWTIHAARMPLGSS